MRPVVFAAYSGTSRWMNSAGEVLSSSLSGAEHQGGRGQGLAHGAQPDGQVDPARHRRGRRPPDRHPGVRRGRRRRAHAGDGHRDRAGVRRRRQAGHRPRPGARAVRRPAVEQEDRGLPHRHRPLAGGREAGVRGSRHRPAQRLPVGVLLPHAAVLRPGGRPRRARAQRPRERHRVPAGRAAAAGPGRGDGGGAQPRRAHLAGGGQPRPHARAGGVRAGRPGLHRPRRGGGVRPPAAGRPGDHGGAVRRRTRSSSGLPGPADARADRLPARRPGRRRCAAIARARCSTRWRRRWSRPPGATSTPCAARSTSWSASWPAARGAGTPRSTSRSATAVPGPTSASAPFEILQERRDWLLGRVG